MPLVHRGELLDAAFDARVLADMPTGAAIVEVHGELDLFSAAAFTASVRDAERVGAAALLIDLCGATFIDSKGLTAVLEAQRRATAARRLLAVACPATGAVHRALELCGIERCVTVRPSRADALAGFAERLGERAEEAGASS